MTGAILDASAVPDALTVEICIIGSGSGGATAAWDLAKAGRDVLVLEEGGDYTGPRLSQRDGEMYDQLYMDRGGRSTTDLSISVLQGRVLGGGGVINAADVVTIGDDVLTHWQKTYGLTDFSPQTLAPFKARALEDLHANVPAEGQLNRNNTLLRAGTQKLGWAGEVMHHNRVGCAGVGACMIGCPLNAKKNPRFVAIPAAVDAGARFITRVRAVRIDDAGQELKTVRARRLDPKGYHEGTALTVKAKHVILAANAIASAQLLIQSGLGNDHVGRHLMLQPQQPVVARFAEDVRFFRGIPQAYAVTQFETRATDDKPWWGYRIEAIAGTPGIVASLIPEIGTDGQKLMADYPRFAASLLLTPDEGQGRVTVEKSGRLRIAYALNDEQKGRIREAVVNTAKIYLAAGATDVVVPVSPAIWMKSEADFAKVKDLTLAPATSPMMSAHQQGTVRFAASAKDGGADPDGQVYGTKGVYVFDSSGFPSSASSHTMTPIIAISHYLTAKLLSRV